MVRRGPEKIGPAHPSNESPSAPKSAEIVSTSECVGETSPTAIVSADGKTARADARPRGSSTNPDENRTPRQGDRSAADRGQVAGRLGEGERERRASRSDAAQVVHDRPVPLHERVPTPRFRDFVPASGVSVAISSHARVQRPPSGGVSLHGSSDPGRREAHRREGAEAVGHPAEDGNPGPRHSKVRGPDALDRGISRGRDGGLEGPGCRGGLDPVLHHDPAEPALRRVRAMAVPSPPGRRLRQDRQAPSDLVSERPSPYRGSRPPRGRGGDAERIHTPEVSLGGWPIPRRRHDPTRDRLRADESLGGSGCLVCRRKGRRGTMGLERTRDKEALGARPDRGRGVDRPGGRPRWQGCGRSRDQSCHPRPARVIHRPGSRHRHRHDRPFRCPGRFRRLAGPPAG